MVESATGVTRQTVKRIAALLGIGEEQVVHRALRELAAKVLPNYERNDAPLTAARIHEIRQRIPQGEKGSLSFNLFESDRMRCAAKSLARLKKFRGRLPANFTFGRDETHRKA